MIKVILLDYGKVIAPENNGPAIRDIYGVSDKDFDAAYTIFGSLKNHLFTGTLNEQNVKEQLEQRGIQVAADYEERCKNVVHTYLRPTQEMLELILQLEKQGYKIALLSNVWPLTANIIQKQGWYDSFDVVYLSCELGLAKPNYKIYDFVLSDLAVAAGEILFVDDKKDNLIYPSQIGMHTLQVADPIDAVTKISDYL